MKYRLKQWYPSLPNVWTEGDVVKEYSGKYYNKETIDGSNGIPKREVENNPEYWESEEDAKELMDKHKPKFSEYEIVKNALTAMRVSCQPINADRSRIELEKLLDEFDINLHDIV